MMLETSKNSWHYINEGITATNYNSFKKAISRFNKALQIEPENMVAQFHKGTTLYKIESFFRSVLRTIQRFRITGIFL